MSEPLKPALPARPHLNWLKNRAKEKLAQLHAADPSAQLADAQLALAREHGFASWRALKVYIDAINFLGGRLLQAIRSGDAKTLESLLDEHPAVVNASIDKTAEMTLLPTD